MRTLERTTIHNRRAAFNKEINGNNTKLAFRTALKKESSLTYFSSCVQGQITHEPRVVIKTAADYFRGKQNIPHDCIDPNGNLIPLPTPFKNTLASGNINSEEIHRKIDRLDLRNKLKSIKRNSSPGMDGITMDMITAMSDHSFNTLRSAFDDILSNRDQIPTKLKTAYVSFIPKKSGYSAQELTQPNLFRPITVLPIIYRIITNIVNHRLQNVIQNSGIISQNQRGFTKKAKTCEVPQAIKNVCSHAKKAKGNIYITMVDYSDAYGSVIHDRLMEIIKYMGFPPNSLNLFEQLIRGHGLHIKTHYGLTNRIDLKKGIAQGDPIAPTLFNIYTELVTRVIKDIRSGYPINFIDHSIVAYADDTTIISNTHNRAQIQLNKLVEVAAILGLRVNDKTKLTGFKYNKTKLLPINPLLLQGKPLEVVAPNSPVKIVGFTFTADNNNGVAGKALTGKILEVANKLNLAHLKPHHAITVINATIAGNVRYYGALNDINNSSIDTINRLTRALTRQNIYTSPSAPRSFFFSNREHNGMGLGRIYYPGSCSQQHCPCPELKF